MYIVNRPPEKFHPPKNFYKNLVANSYITPCSYVDFKSLSRSPGLGQWVSRPFG